MQEPWLEQVGSMHWPSSTLHSAPFHPARHTHLPFSYTPFPLHSTGHESAEQNRQIRAAHSQGRACKHSLLQYMSCETAVTHCERGYALLSQLGRRFSKSSSCLLALSLSHTHSHMHIQSHARTIGLIPYSFSIFSSTTWAWLPRQPRNRRKSPQTSPRSLWTGRENNHENGRLGERAFGFIKREWKSALDLCTDGELCV